MTTDLARVTGLALRPGTEEFERTATWMAREYREATAELRRLMLLMAEQSRRLDRAFSPDDPKEYWHNPFDVEFQYDGCRERARTDQTDQPDLDRLFGKMKRQAWKLLIDRLGVKNLMSVKTRAEFERQLKSGDLPEIDEDAILSVILGLVDQARDFATDAAKEVFEILRPQGAWGGQYKTNDAFRVGRRVILPYRVEQCWNGKQYRVSYSHEQELVAIDGVFHLLDGKGVMREHKGPLVRAIEASPDGRGETDYFRFKCFKNRNLHLEMRRLDLVKQLNGLAAGEYVLGADPD
jgi:hypothetical protein